MTDSAPSQVPPEGWPTVRHPHPPSSPLWPVLPALPAFPPEPALPAEPPLPPEPAAPPEPTVPVLLALLLLVPLTQTPPVQVPPVHGVPFGTFILAGHVRAVPLQLSGLSHSPTAGRHTTLAGRGAQMPSVMAPAVTLHAWQSVVAPPPHAVYSRHSFFVFFRCDAANAAGVR